jgi:hypothetical protein
MTEIDRMPMTIKPGKPDAGLIKKLHRGHNGSTWYHL